MRGDRTGSITLAGILQLISALETLFVGLLGLSYLLTITTVNLFLDYAILLTAFTYLFAVTFNITSLGAFSLIMLMGIVAIIWGILGLIATAGILRVSRWALWLASIFNIVLIIDMMLLLNNAFARGLIAAASFAVLFYVFLIIFPIVVEIIILVRREDFA